ncbi:hypothetical protein [Pseudomonas anguilliseptica]|uniref:hypothetical protein n=1 Tax=Pseudomonas anguilliseptica TaxID=53406 RepID=UPI003D338B7C
MNSLRSLPINRRLWLILVVAILMLIIQGALLLKQIHSDLYAAKAEKLSTWYRAQPVFCSTITPWKLPAA